MTHPPIAVALGDQIHAEIVDSAKRSVRSVLATEGHTIDGDDQVLVEIGIGAGIHAALATLKARGWVRPPEEGQS